MRVVETVKEMKELICEFKKNNHTIGFVPTMGFLHEGHASLLRKARLESDIVVLSIFVNPLQFGPSEDLESYPRDFERDSKIASEENVDILFYPSVSEMYPTSPSVTLTVTKRVNVLCGKSRPGHFDGVATVLTKLFHIVTPNRAYFGLKDAQQVAVVDGLVNDLQFPLELVAVETVREIDGLAKSSRNVRLTEKEREQAPILYKSLMLAESLIRNGQSNISNIREQMTELIVQQSTGEIDYVEFYSYPQLEELDQIKGKIIVALAVKFSHARLIDNIILTV